MKFDYRNQEVEMTPAERDKKQNAEQTNPQHIETLKDIQRLKKWANKEAERADGVNPWDRRAFKFLASEDPVAFVFLYCLHETLVDMTFRLKNPYIQKNYWWAGLAGLSFTSYDQSQIFLHQWGPVAALWKMNKEYDFVVSSNTKPRAMTVSINTQTKSGEDLVNSLLHAANDLLRHDKGEAAHHLACLSSHGILQNWDDRLHLNEFQIQTMKAIADRFQKINSEAFHLENPDFKYTPPTMIEDPKINWLISTSEKWIKAQPSIVPDNSKQSNSAWRTNTTQTNILSYVDIHRAILSNLNSGLVLGAKYKKRSSASRAAWKEVASRDYGFYNDDAYDAEQQGRETVGGNSRWVDRQFERQKSRDKDRGATDESRGKKSEKGAQRQFTEGEDTVAGLVNKERQQNFSKNKAYNGERSAHDMQFTEDLSTTERMEMFCGKDRDAYKMKTELDYWMTRLEMLFETKKDEHDIDKVFGSKKGIDSFEWSWQLVLNDSRKPRCSLKHVKNNWLIDWPTDDTTLKLLVFRHITVYLYTVVHQYCAEYSHYYRNISPQDHTVAKRFFCDMEASLTSRLKDCLRDEAIGNLRDIAVYFESRSLQLHMEYLASLRTQQSKGTILTPYQSLLINDDAQIDAEIEKENNALDKKRKFSYVHDAVCYTEQNGFGQKGEMKRALLGKNDLYWDRITQLTISANTFAMITEELFHFYDCYKKTAAFLDTSYGIVLTAAKKWLAWCREHAKKDNNNFPPFPPFVNEDWQRWCKSKEQLPSWVESAYTMTDKTVMLTQEQLDKWDKENKELLEGRKAKLETLKSDLKNAEKMLDELVRSGRQTADNRLEIQFLKRQIDIMSKTHDQVHNKMLHEAVSELHLLELYWKHAALHEFKYNLVIFRTFESMGYLATEQAEEQAEDDAATDSRLTRITELKENWTHWQDLVEYVMSIDDYLRDLNLNSESHQVKSFKKYLQSYYRNIFENELNENATMPDITMSDKFGKMLTTKWRIGCQKDNKVKVSDIHYTDFDDFVFFNDEPLGNSTVSNSMRYYLYCSYEHLLRMFPQTESETDEETGKEIKQMTRVWVKDKDRVQDTKTAAATPPPTSEQSPKKQSPPPASKQPPANEQSPPPATKQSQEPEAKTPKVPDTQEVENIYKQIGQIEQARRLMSHQNHVDFLAAQLDSFRRMLEKQDKILLASTKLSDLDAHLTYVKRMQFISDCQRSYKQQVEALTMKEHTKRVTEIDKKTLNSTFNVLQEQLKAVKDKQTDQMLRRLRLKMNEMIQRFKTNYNSNPTYMSNGEQIDLLEELNEKLQDEQTQQFLSNCVGIVNAVDDFEDALYDYGLYLEDDNDESCMSVNAQKYSRLKLEVETSVIERLFDDDSVENGLFDGFLVVFDRYIGGDLHTKYDGKTFDSSVEADLAEIMSERKTGTITIQDVDNLIYRTSKNLASRILDTIAEDEAARKLERTVLDMMTAYFECSLGIKEYQNFVSSFISRDPYELPDFENMLSELGENDVEVKRRTNEAFKNLRKTVEKLSTHFKNPTEMIALCTKQLDSIEVSCVAKNQRLCTKLRELYEEVATSYTEGLNILKQIVSHNNNAIKMWDELQEICTEDQIPKDVKISQWFELYDVQASNPQNGSELFLPASHYLPQDDELIKLSESYVKDAPSQIQASKRMLETLRLGVFQDTVASLTQNSDTERVKRQLRKMFYRRQEYQLPEVYNPVRSIKNLQKVSEWCQQQLIATYELLTGVSEEDSYAIDKQVRELDQSNQRAFWRSRNAQDKTKQSSRQSKKSTQASEKANTTFAKQRPAQAKQKSAQPEAKKAGQGKGARARRRAAEQDKRAAAQKATTADATKTTQDTNTSTQPAQESACIYEPNFSLTRTLSTYQ